ncbi:hypothetical protein Q9R08_04840 [Microbacterium sp. QXD-8]|uniref:DUF5343 domain-containing protein n=1 Tax=Microbacterium psychrotolerans TaxID=3068321 RepID=A0ABU0YY90_9MICO|nr:hypothetical protein [Microbacterium sp. QXD-8]MDQ7877298.1 hypothetical protein [Microbacterium sp. QXD-8]
MIPMKTIVDDLDKLTAYLRPSFGWVSLAKVKSNLEKVSDNRKIEAARWLGLISRDGQNVEITDAGRKYASAQDFTEKSKVMLSLMAQAPLYAQTLEWMYFTNKSDPTKTDVGDQWYRHYSDLLEGAQGAALGDGVIVFMRVAEAAGLGKFITAGKNRPETYFKGERAAIENFYNTYLVGKKHEDDEDSSEDDAEYEDQGNSGESAAQTAPANIRNGNAGGRQGGTTGTQQVTLQTSPAIHINLEIHIAADATAETVAEIFKNMRKYVLNDGPAEAVEGE